MLRLPISSNLVTILITVEAEGTLGPILLVPVLSNPGGGPPGRGRGGGGELLLYNDQSVGDRKR